MATRRFKFSPGDPLVVEEAGAAVNSDLVELTVECASTGITAGAATRQISRVEVIESLQKILDHVAVCAWPPV